MSHQAPIPVDPTVLRGMLAWLRYAYESLPPELHDEEGALELLRLMQAGQRALAAEEAPCCE